MKSITLCLAVGLAVPGLNGGIWFAATLCADEPAKSGAKEVKPARALLLTFDALEKRLKETDPALRLLDCRPRADYDKGHVPGAVWVDTKALEAQAAKPGGLEDRPFWEEWGTTLGLDPKMTVFAYGAKRQLDAAREWFLLRWIGVVNVGLIDGGFPLSAKQNRPVATAVPKIEPRPFQVDFRKDVAAGRDDVLAAIKDNSASVLDARSDAEFAGTDKKSKRGGHVPAACHLEWTNLVDEDGRFLDRQALKAKVEKSGIKLGSEVICHCQGGGRASVNTFALEFLGTHARNYYLGWSDWGNAEDTPAVEGPEAGKQ